MMNASARTSKPSVLTLLLLVALASVSAVMYTPAIPSIRQFFGVSTTSVQFTVTIFLIGYMLGQLIYGPLAKAYGRKKTLYIGISIAIMGSLVCALSEPFDSFSMFLVGRLVQSLGASAGLCVAFILLNEAFEGEEARRVSILVTMAFAILPSVSIFLGGFIMHYLNWESIFYILAAYMFLVGLIASRLPETGIHDSRYKIRVSVMAKDYLAVLKSLPFVIFAVSWGLCTAIVYIFSATSPDISMGHLGMNPVSYGTANLVVSAALLLGILLNLFLSKYLSGIQSVFLGAVISIFAALYLAFVYLYLAPSLYDFFGTVCVLYMGLALVFPNASSLSMNGVEDKASGAAMMSFLNMATAVILQWVVSLFRADLFLSVVITFLTVSVVLLLMLGIGRLSRPVS